MGRTNPTYRDLIDQLEDEMQPFRRALRRTDTADFDRLFDRARRYADAGGYLNSQEPMRVVLFSMLLAQEHELRQLRERVGEGDDATAHL
ncbi:MAG: hypothetical protein V5A55_06705 [Halovenus sp.]